MDLRDAIQRIALDGQIRRPDHGRAVTAGRTVNPKRVYRLLVRTTDDVCASEISGDDRFPSRAGFIRTWRARWCSPASTSSGVADITYIGLETEFVYLAAVIDAFRVA